ncbi:MAG TPA: alcohol dehydrogenase [Thermoplasmata archaeon]|nr:alcohol dehydrogenase [Thermoplasmata archaeon]
MKAAVYYNNKDVRVQEIPVPKINKNELLVKIKASGICGSDVMEWYRIKKTPRVLGHEITGDVVETGKNIAKYKVGDRVFVSHHVPCNTCKYCLNGTHTLCDTLHSTNFDPGGFAEYIRVPEINVDRGVFPLPNEISYEEGVFIEPLACVIRGFHVAEVKPSQTVLIIGSGISGLLQLKLAKAWGAKKVICVDVNEYRIKKAMEFGADLALHANDDVPGKIKKINDGYLADTVIVSTGASKAVLQAIESVDRGGTILLFAPMAPDIKLPIKMFKVWNKGVKIVSTYAGAPKDIRDAIEILKSKTVEVNDMITHRIKLDDIQRGFELVAEAKNSIKIIVLP